MARDTADEVRDGVSLTNLDGPLFAGADATKRDLVDYLDAVSGPLVAALRNRPLSVVRARPGQDPFMQKNVPKYTPEWVRTTTVWAESSHREIRYALCDDRATLLWFANQRAVEYHPTLFVADDPAHPTHLILDLDPPEGAGFDVTVAAAHLVRRVLRDLGIEPAVKTSGSKGVHVVSRLAPGTGHEDAAAATRAIAARAERIDPDLATTAFIRADRAGKVFLDPTRAGGGTVAAAYSPRVRPGATVSFPVAWDDLDSVTPADFTLRTAPALLAGNDPWSDALAEAHTLPAQLIEEGHTIPVPRVQAMHEGKRRARARRDAGSSG